MINTLTRNATIVASMAAIMVAVSTAAFSQAPTDAQRSAIRSQCRSDYIAHCSSVPPGGEASLQCLQKNMASLSAACQGAVRAVEPPAAPKAEAAPPKTEPAAEPKTESATAPRTEPAPAAAKPAETATAPAPKAAETPAAAAAPKAAAGTGAKKPSSAQIAAIRSSCRADYPRVCAGVPTGGEAALSCLEKSKAKVSASCQQALNAASGGGAAPATGGAAATATAPAAAPAAAPALVLRPMRPREELFVLRSACGGDVRALCGGVPVGGGRIIQCLASQAASISPACKEVLGQFAAQ
jgi:hypothetical protein